MVVLPELKQSTTRSPECIAEAAHWWPLGWCCAAGWCAALLVGLAGCHRGDPPTFQLSKDAGKLSAPLQQAVDVELVKYTGNYLQPKLLAATEDEQHDLSRGRAVYQERCVQCHGVSGDGEGPAAKYMYPAPRDYRQGMFKFTSTPYGSRPRRDDLVRTLRAGIRGTSMPAFNLLPEADVQSVVDYVLMLARRGELERQLVNLADQDGAIDAEEVKTDVVETLATRWLDAEGVEVLPATTQPRLTLEHVERGKKAFLTKGCSKCHGEDGRGQTLDNRGKDVWGHPTRAADLTSGMLHGGARPIDVYRRIYSGINGTPMPSFAAALKEEPDTLWDLVAYVLSVSNERRQGRVPLPGPIKPYQSAEEASAAPAPAPSQP